MRSADKEEEVGKQVFIADVLYTDDPYEGVLSSCEKKNDEHSRHN